MGKMLRAIGIGLASAGMALSAAAGAQAANVALMVNGMGAGNLTDLAMANILGGMFGSYQRQNVPWPQQARLIGQTKGLTLGESINVGANNLDAALQTALKQLKPGEHVTIVGLSAGALVADEELRRLASSPTAPDKSKLNFVVVADSSRINFNKNRYDGLLNYTYRPPVDSKYDTKAVVGEYDGYADFPDRPWNLLAVQNALIGAQLVHIPSMLTKLSTVPAANVKTTVNAKGGVTTSYLVPTPTLPLVMLNPSLKPQEAALRKQIDSAYFRNDPKVISAATTVAAPLTPVAPAPVADVPVAPVADVPVAPAVPVAPVANVPVAPVADVPAAPVADVPAAPIADVPVAPIADMPARPTADVPAARAADTRVSIPAHRAASRAAHNGDAKPAAATRGGSGSR